MELEEDRKSLAKRESLTTNMELQLERQREALKSLKESAAKKTDSGIWSRSLPASVKPRAAS